MYVTVTLDTYKQNFLLETNIEIENVRDFIINWIKNEDIGKGEDKREVVQKSQYNISIYKDRNGKYDIKDDCENRDLRRGILGIFIKDFKNIRNVMEGTDGN